MSFSMRLILSISAFYISTTIFSHLVSGAIVINEIMYNPIGDDNNNEWIELYNPTNQTFNLTNWIIGDSASNDTLTILNGSSILLSNSFILITEEGFNTSRYPNVSIMSAGAAIGNNLNNDGDSIFLFDSNNTLVDSLTYFTSWGANGDEYTLERIDPNEPTNSSTNWKPSNNINGTLGSKNSVTPSEHDLAIYPENITFSPSDPSPRTEVNISVTIQNNGISNETNVNISIYNISGSTLTLIHSQLSNITKQSSSSTTVKWNNTLKGNSTILVRFENFTDDNTTNNNATKNITFDFHLVINEIMYNPPEEIGSDADFEWLEIYNNATYVENLTGWILQCDSKSKSLSSELSSNSYLVFAKDRTQFYTYYSSSISTESQTCSLNNDGDTIKLIFNDSGIYHEETVSYSPSWGADGTGYSLEKRNPTADNNSTNWAESKVYAGTPGARNNPDTQIKSSLKSSSTVTLYRSNTEIIYAEKPETPDYKMVSFPEVVYVDEPFKTIVSMKSAKEQIVSAYSYVYDGKMLLSEGFNGNIWKARWDANKKDIKIGPTSVYVEFENKMKPDTPSGQYKFRVRIRDEVDLTKDIEVLQKRAETQSLETNSSMQLSIDCEQIENQAKIQITSPTEKAILLMHFSKEPTKNETLNVNGSLTHELNLEDGYNSIIFVENDKILISCSFSLQKQAVITGKTAQVISINKILAIVKSWFEKISFLSIFTNT